MSHVVRRMTHPRIDEYNTQSFFLQDRLPTPRQQSDDLLLLVGDSQLSADAGIWLAIYYVGAWIGTSLLNGPHDGVHWHMAHLDDAKLLKSTFLQNESDNDHQVFLFQLTMTGWDQFYEMKRQRNESRAAFMAMKFGDQMLNEAVDQCFRSAVERSGYKLRVLTEPAPAGMIDDQLRSAILGSRFVIADLSHGNNGAYWEAGFGEGRGLPVIYTCEESAWKAQKTHFDTNHLRTIIWSNHNFAKAEKELTATIRATLPNEAIQENTETP